MSNYAGAKPSWMKVPSASTTKNTSNTVYAKMDPRNPSYESNLAKARANGGVKR